MEAIFVGFTLKKFLRIRNWNNLHLLKRALPLSSESLKGAVTENFSGPSSSVNRSKNRAGSAPAYGMRFCVESPPPSIAILEADGNFIYEFTSMFSSIYWKGKRRYLVGTGIKLMTEKTSFDVKLICHNENFPALSEDGINLDCCNLLAR